MSRAATKGTEMKSMFTLEQLVQQLRHDEGGKADYIMPAANITMVPSAEIALEGVGDVGTHPLTNNGHRQLGDFVNIPAVYYDRMLDKLPDLLATNVNQWMSTRAKERRMVRLMHGRMRSLLSDRYQRIDHTEVAEVILNEVSRVKGARVVSSAVTESRMHIKVITHEVTADVRGSAEVGDVIAAGMYAGNSETGHGAVFVKAFIERLVCKNGMVRDDGKMRANHVGARNVDLDGILSDSTRRLEDEVILHKIRDVVRHCFDPAALQRVADAFSNATQEQITGQIPAAVEVLGPSIGLLEHERASVLDHLIRGGDLSRWGMANAITRTAEDVESYDRATELETLGYRLIELPKAQWSRIATATAS